MKVWDVLFFPIILVLAPVVDILRNTNMSNIGPCKVPSAAYVVCLYYAERDTERDRDMTETKRE